MLELCKATVGARALRCGYCIVEDLAVISMETTRCDSNHSRDGEDEEDEVQVRM